MWGATSKTSDEGGSTYISIHAPRVGRDLNLSMSWSSATHFNPRAPCGARHRIVLSGNPEHPFQSTRPVWGATKGADGAPGIYYDFNPRAPCGARRESSSHHAHFSPISIHAPRVGRDHAALRAIMIPCIISIHAPRVGRDQLSPLPMHGSGISIHAPRVGRDLRRSSTGRTSALFQSTRPVWGATSKVDTGGESKIFQSTRPVWGATAGDRQQRHQRDISIHAPRVGRDFIFVVGQMRRLISIHAPRVGRDRIWESPVVQFIVFQSTRPVWGATISCMKRLWQG